MRTKDVDSVCLIDIEGITISKTDIIELKRIFKKYATDRRIGINLEKVKFAGYDFWTFIKESSNTRRISFYNVNTEIFLNLLVSKYDDFSNIYINEQDFIIDKRRMVHRRLKLLRSA